MSLNGASEHDWSPMDFSERTTGEFDLVNISSSSEDSPMVQRPNFDEIEERFRSVVPRTDVMTAFLGPEVAPLFAHEMFNIPDETPAVNLSGTAIEREMNAMMGDLDDFPDLSLSSINNSTPEEDRGRDIMVNVEQYAEDVFPTALPSPITNERVIPTYPQSRSAQQVNNPPALPPNQQMPVTLPAQLQMPQPYPHFAPGPYQTQSNLSYGNPPCNIGVLPHSVIPYPYVPYHVPYQETRYNHEHISLPTNMFANGLPMQMSPPVMPYVAGACAVCKKTYDQIAVEILIEYVGTTEYPEETIKDRNVRSRAFIDGFEAAVFTLKNAGLSRSYVCDGSVVQQ